MARRRQTAEGQGSLFDAVSSHRSPRESVAVRPVAQNPGGAMAGAAVTTGPKRRWQMPAVEGKTVAEIRLRWPKRLTPAQVARVEAELAALPKLMTRLGFGTVVVERAFVRRRKS